MSSVPDSSSSPLSFLVSSVSGGVDTSSGLAGSDGGAGTAAAGGGGPAAEVPPEGAGVEPPGWGVDVAVLRLSRSASGRVSSSRILREGEVIVWERSGRGYKAQGS